MGFSSRGHNGWNQVWITSYYSDYTSMYSATFLDACFKAAHESVAKQDREQGMQDFGPRISCWFPSADMASLLSRWLKMLSSHRSRTHFKLQVILFCLFLTGAVLTWPVLLGVTLPVWTVQSHCTCHRISGLHAPMLQAPGWELNHKNFCYLRGPPHPIHLSVHQTLHSHMLIHKPQPQ